MAIVKKDGYNYVFDTDACKSCNGKCCIGESGYIWVDDEEILKLAALVDMKLEDFMQQYLKKVNSRYTLKEIEHESGFSCVFFNSEKIGCEVYNSRPSQCCTFPFWEYFKSHKKELENECLGVLYL